MASGICRTKRARPVQGVAIHCPNWFGPSFIWAWHNALLAHLFEKPFEKAVPFKTSLIDSMLCGKVITHSDVNVMCLTM